MERILVIDDDPMIRKVLVQCLTKQGYDVDEAPDGASGMRRYQENPVKIVITDLIMPEKEGIETIIELKHDFPDVKIIAISGGGNLDPELYLGAALHLGVDRVFKKPFELAKIRNAVRELLNG